MHVRVNPSRKPSGLALTGTLADLLSPARLVIFGTLLTTLNKPMFAASGYVFATFGTVATLYWITAAKASTFSPAKSPVAICDTLCEAAQNRSRCCLEEVCTAMCDPSAACWGRPATRLVQWADVPEVTMRLR